MIEIYEVKGGKRPGWRFRTVDKAGGEPTYTSNGVYPTEERAREVAGKVNVQMWAGSHKIRKPRRGAAA